MLSTSWRSTASVRIIMLYKILSLLHGIFFFFFFAFHLTKLFSSETLQMLIITIWNASGRKISSFSGRNCKKMAWNKGGKPRRILSTKASPVCRPIILLGVSRIKFYEVSAALNCWNSHEIFPVHLRQENIRHRNAINVYSVFIVICWFLGHCEWQRSYGVRFRRII